MGGLTLDALTLQDVDVELSMLDTNVRGTLIIDMANADLSLTEEQSLNTNIIITSPGNGTKVLTIFSSPNNPANYDILIAGGGTISLSDGGISDTVPIFSYGRVLYAYGVGIERNVSDFGVYCKNVLATSLANNTTAQTMMTCHIPANTFHDNSDELLMRFSLRKSEATNTATVSVTIDGQTIWTNNTLATTNRSLAAGISFSRTGATTLKMNSTTNSSSLFGPTTADFTSITVGDMNAVGMDIKIIVTQNAISATETTTLNTAMARMTRALL